MPADRSLCGQAILASLRQPRWHGAWRAWWQALAQPNRSAGPGGLLQCSLGGGADLLLSPPVPLVLRIGSTRLQQIAASCTAPGTARHRQALSEAPRPAGDPFLPQQGISPFYAGPNENKSPISGAPRPSSAPEGSGSTMKHYMVIVEHTPDECENHGQLANLGIAGAVLVRGGSRRHKGWAIVDADSEQDALKLRPRCARMPTSSLSAATAHSVRALHRMAA